MRNDQSRAVEPAKLKIGLDRPGVLAGQNAGIGLFGRIAFYGMLATILVFAIPYGTVETFHKAALAVSICVFGLFRVADGVKHGRYSIATPLLLLPLVGILGLAALQTVRMPSLGSPISLDPYETRSFILVFGSLIVCVEVLFTYADTTARLKLLAATVLAVAVGSAFFGFFREFAEPGLFADYISSAQGFGQFINRNHFALLIEMAFGLLFGILLKAELSEKYRFAGWVIGGILLYAIIAANSRGGLISLAGLVLFAVFVHILTRRPSASAGKRAYAGDLGNSTIFRKLLTACGLCILVFALIVVIVAFVGGDSVAMRLEKIGGEVETLDNAKVNRNLIWNSTVDLIKARPLLGSGFGAYKAAITQFDASNGGALLEEAHNDYLEILANGGIAGLFLFAIFGVLVAIRISKSLRSEDRLRRALGFGAATGLFGALIHSFVDFGLHIMINALVFAVLVVIATADNRTEPKLYQHPV